MIGTDSPDFPADFIEDAFKMLENEADAVLGETEDGGYYLIGFKMLKKDVFANVHWSSEKTFKQTVRNIKKMGLEVGFLPIWYDVDEAKDLKRLERATEKNLDVATETIKWLKNNL